jgi:N-acetylmuramoyl-L-alanine amidase
LEKIFPIFLSISLLMMAVSPSTQKKTEVLLKFSKQEGIMRIVFEGERTLINNSKISTSPSEIKIEFPWPFTMTAPEDLPFEIAVKDKLLVINLKEKGEIKFFSLSSPARLVFDVQKKEKQTETQPAPIISKVFVIDAGHGGYDFGITSGDVSEKSASLDLAKDLGKVLLKKGKKVFLTRKVDQYVSLNDRINFINQKSPDVFISFHSSMSEDFILYSPKFEEQGSDEIIDSYSLSTRQKKYIKKSKLLSDGIEGMIKEEFKANVIRREMPLPILNSVGAPSVLIELPSPRFLVYDQQMRTRLINSIINGVALYGQ